MPTPVFTIPPDWVNGQVITEPEFETYFANNPWYLYQKGHQAGTGFPGSPAANDKFFRTDRGLDYFWDGARWLTLDEYNALVTPIVNTSTSFFTTSHIVLPTVYAPYFTTITASIRVNTTNNASNRWTLFIQGLNDSLGSSNDITTFDTGAIAVNTYVVVNNAVNATPTHRTHLRVVAVKTGSPGSLDMAVTAHYRQVG